ncbi:hypothetical protein MCUN1_000810 [Malassezia cuniculi]|uniref:Coenzyme Q-binding protein COQ10 START domain-containing protein n=1 Tax=Malassezia cuniculi TaxID=948313 RepID=A0AAF0EWD7_9BASI|nr:hypothetical protein MCUN1_000810 [Malassezia cuniculi]
MKSRESDGAKKIVDAELSIGFASIKESYTSEVRMLPNQWVKVQFTLEYAFSNPIYAAIARQAFSTLSSNMIQAFAARAREVYGQRA